MGKPVDILQGTLDMLILKAVSLGPLHGYGILLRIQQVSKDALQIPQGSLYPALYRAGASRLDRRRVGRKRKQAQGQVLPPDRRRAQAIEVRAAGVEASGGAIADVLAAEPEEV